MGEEAGRVAVEFLGVRGRSRWSIVYMLFITGGLNVAVMTDSENLEAWEVADFKTQFSSLLIRLCVVNLLLLLQSFEEARHTTLGYLALEA